MTMGGDGNVDWSPSLREKMVSISKDMIQAKDITTGKIIKAHKSDPRWVNKELAGQNFGKVNLNKDGKLDNYVLAKNKHTGEVSRLKSDSDEWLSGEYVGFNKGKPCPESTKLAASMTHKGKPKSDEQNKKCSDTIKQLKWYCNFRIDKVGRFNEGRQPPGYVRVSGPHKRKII